MYRRLAAVVCPSAPFLVPKRAIQSSYAVSYPSAYTQITQIPPIGHGYSTRTREIKKKRRRDIGIAKSQVRETELQAIKQQGPAPEDVAVLAQKLQQDLRARDKPPGALDALYAQALKLANDIRLGKLPGSAASSVHLLGIFRDTKHYEEGIKFWNWVKDREDGSVDQVVYGVALELLAYRGTALQVVEPLYKEALERYAGTFAEYHLSPTGIVPDRRLRLPSLKGLPMSLIQGIETARLLLGDWRGAYMSFDTALRLMPDRTLTSMYTRLIRERSIPEALIVYAMACRSKVSIPPATVTTLLQRLVAQRSYKSQFQKIDFNIELIAIMLEVLHLRIMAGNELQPEHLSIIIKGMRNATIPYVSRDLPKSDAVIYNDVVVGCARDLVEALVQHNRVSSPHNHNTIYNSLLAFSAARNNNDTVQYAQLHLAQTNFHDDIHAHTSLLVAAGYNANLTSIKGHWNEIIRISEQKPAWRDWITLAHSLRQFPRDSAEFQDLRTFFESQWDQFGLHVGNAQNHERFLVEILEKVELRDTKDYQENLPSGEQLKAYAERIRVSVQELQNAAPSEKMIESFLSTSIFRTSGSAVVSEWIPPNQDSRATESSENDNDTFSDTSMPSPSLSQEPTIPIYELQLTEIYDSLTTDPMTPPEPLPHNSQIIDSAGIPYDVHRFENWKDINKLLAIAEAVESRKRNEVRRATSGKATRAVDMEEIDGWILRRMRGWDGRVWRTTVGDREEGLRERILNLRGLI